MARLSVGPWFRVSKSTWYATIEGRSVSLGVKGKGSKSLAVKAWLRLVSGERKPEAMPKPVSMTVGEAVAEYLAAARQRVSVDAYRGYAKYLLPFAEALGKRPVAGLTSADVGEFMVSQTTWGDTYKAGFHGTLSQMLKRALEEGHVAKNIMAKVPKPCKTSRGAEAVLTADEHAKLLAFADPEMHDLLIVLWGTGARPSEVASLTAAIVKASVGGVIMLLAHKLAHKGKQRHLILSGEALAIVQRRASEREGYIFQGVNGKLTATAIGLRVTRLCRKAGVRHLVPYGYRHTFATDALAKGVPDATVAALLGHCDTSMIHKHYSHLSSRTRLLKDAALTIRG
jgi:integrase